jgi:endonuclease/exonuclease/phosphatase family metal-dependent hydrolase
LIAAKDVAPWPWDLPDHGLPGHGQCAPISTEISTACLYSTGNRDTQPRNLLVVPVAFAPNASVYFMATHLATLTEENRHDRSDPRSKEASDVRLGQVGEILRVVKELRAAEQRIHRDAAPLLLAGDFNAKPDSPEIQALEQTFLRPPPRWQDPAKMAPPVWTHVGHEIHVDHILCSDPGGLVSPLDCFVLTPELIADATDHLPVVARFGMGSG